MSSRKDSDLTNTSKEKNFLQKFEKVKEEWANKMGRIKYELKEKYKKRVNESP